MMFLHKKLFIDIRVLSTRYVKNMLMRKLYSHRPIFSARAAPLLPPMTEQM